MARVGLNRYAQLIADEARRRGIDVEVLDAATGELRLRHGGRCVTTIESLSELTSAVAFRRCDDKAVTRRVLGRAGLRLPAGRVATGDDEDLRFLREHGDIVVKPCRGEGGAGITVGVVDEARLAEAVAVAAAVCPRVLLEERCDGDDLRIVVIDGEVVAAAVRRPATVVGDGVTTIAALVRRLGERRARATGGASSLTDDETTRQVVAAAGHALDDILAPGTSLPVRRTANVHTGGSIEDVTARLHPVLAEVAVTAAEAIGIPVLGVDLMVPEVEGPDYVVLEANEQPGLANHEPQPTAARFVDLLFPATRVPPGAPASGGPGRAGAGGGAP